MQIGCYGITITKKGESQSIHSDLIQELIDPEDSTTVKAYKQGFIDGIESLILSLSCDGHDIMKLKKSIEVTLESMINNKD